MIRWWWIGCGLVLVARLGAAAGDPLLPQWGDGDQGPPRRGEVAPGILLLGRPLSAEGREAETPPGLAPLLTPLPEEETAEPPATEIPAECLGEYFGQRPSSFLVDPQRLLSRQERRDRVGFLDFHAGASGSNLYLYLFGARQELPAEVRNEEWGGRFFAKGKPSALMFCFLGAPQRSELRLSPSLARLMTPAQHQSALRNSVADALKMADPVDQLDRFLVRMSICLYQLEKAGGGFGREAGPLVVLADKPVPPPKTKWWQPWLLKARAWKLPAAVLGGAATVFLLTAWLLRLRARYRFPKIEVQPRLGGPHGACVGVLLTFSDPNLPPMDQREQVPEHLRRK